MVFCTDHDGNYNPFLAPPFTEVQKQVADLTNGKILVGHAVHNDLKVGFLFLFFWHVSSINSEDESF